MFDEQKYVGMEWNDAKRLALDNDDFLIATHYEGKLYGITACLNMSRVCATVLNGFVTKAVRG